MPYSRRLLRMVFVVAILLVTTVCAGPFGPTQPVGPEAYCASLTSLPGFSLGVGKFFYCRTTLASLDVVDFPDGSQGFCAPTNDAGLGITGYIWYSSYGGIAQFVTSQAQAEAGCNPHNFCAGILQCKRSVN